MCVTFLNVKLDGKKKTEQRHRVLRREKRQIQLQNKQMFLLQEHIYLNIFACRHSIHELKIKFDVTTEYGYLKHAN